MKLTYSADRGNFRDPPLIVIPWISYLATVVTNVAVLWDREPCSPYVNWLSQALVTSIFRVEKQPSKKPTFSRWRIAEDDKIVKYILFGTWC
jgi:hypothetical protein